MSDKAATQVNVVTMKAAGHERDPDEWYVDEPHCIELLAKVEHFNGPIWDPCCGLGTIPRGLRAAGYDVLATDQARRGYEDIGGINFMGEDLPPDHPVNFVFNPPYGHAALARTYGASTMAQAFIDRARRLATGKVCALLPLQFLASQERYRWWVDSYPTRLWFISSRPSMPPGTKLVSGEIKAQGGKQDFFWAVWAYDEPERLSPESGWLALPDNELKRRRAEYPKGWWA